MRPPPARAGRVGRHRAGRACARPRRPTGGAARSPGRRRGRPRRARPGAGPPWRTRRRCRRRPRRCAPLSSSPTAPVRAATTGVPQASDSSAARPNVSIGPGHSATSAEARSVASASRSGTWPRNVTGASAASRRSGRSSGPEPAITSRALTPLRRRDCSATTGRWGRFSAESRQAITVRTASSPRRSRTLGCTARGAEALQVDAPAAHGHVGDPGVMQLGGAVARRAHDVVEAGEARVAPPHGLAWRPGKAAGQQGVEALVHDHRRRDAARRGPAGQRAQREAVVDLQPVRRERVEQPFHAGEVHDHAVAPGARQARRAHGDGRADRRLVVGLPGRGHDQERAVPVPGVATAQRRDRRADPAGRGRDEVGDDRDPQGGVRGAGHGVPSGRELTGAARRADGRCVVPQQGVADRVPRPAGDRGARGGARSRRSRWSAASAPTASSRAPAASGS